MLLTALVQFVVFDGGDFLWTLIVRVLGEEESGKVEREKVVSAFGGGGGV